MTPSNSILLSEVRLGHRVYLSGDAGDLENPIRVSTGEVKGLEWSSDGTRARVTVESLGETAADTRVCSYVLPATHRLHTLHEEVALDLNGTVAMVDQGIAPLVRALNAHGLETLGCCEGYSGAPEEELKPAQIAFKRASDAMSFLMLSHQKNPRPGDPRRLELRSFSLNLVTFMVLPDEEPRGSVCFPRAQLLDITDLWS